MQEELVDTKRVIKTRKSKKDAELWKTTSEAETAHSSRNLEFVPGF
jgi:hypothetical protein